MQVQDLLSSYGQLIAEILIGVVLGRDLYNGNKAARNVDKTKQLRFWIIYLWWVCLSHILAPAIILFAGREVLLYFRSFENSAVRICGIAIGWLVSGVLGRFAIRLSYRYWLAWQHLAWPRAENVDASNWRAPILYLRPFREDREEAPRETFLPIHYTYELCILSGFSRFGPCLAVGRPGEQFPEIGATRLYIEDSQWKEKVTELLKRARFVLISTASTEGVRWEVQQTFLTTPIDRIVLMFLWRRGDAAGRGEREAEYTSTRAAIAEVANVRMPDHLGKGLFMLFKKDGTAVVIGDSERPHSRDFKGYVDDLIWRLGVQSISRTEVSTGPVVGHSSRSEGERNESQINAELGLHYQPMMKRSSHRRKIWNVLYLVLCLWQLYAHFRTGILFVTECLFAACALVLAIACDVVGDSQANKAAAEFNLTGDVTVFGTSLFQQYFGIRRWSLLTSKCGVGLALLASSLWAFEAVWSKVEKNR